MICVGILSYRRPWVLERCLASLFAHTRVPLEVHILNQGYLDGRLEEVYRRFPVRVTYADTNLGCAGGRRLLARLNRSPFLFFADDDLVFTPGWEAPLLEAMQANPGLGAVAPYLQEWRTPFFGRFEWQDRTLRARCYSKAELRRRNGLVETDFLPGGCALLRQSIFAEVGFDEGCRYNWEDVDLWLQLRGTGWRLALCLDSQVHHRRPLGLLSRAAREYDAERYDPGRLQESRRYFLGKWQLRDFQFATSTPAWLRALKSALWAWLKRRWLWLPVEC